MKKDFGVKTWLYPMPVLMIAPITYDPVAHVYRRLAAPIAQAFKVGLGK